MHGTWIGVRRGARCRIWRLAVATAGALALQTLSVAGLVSRPSLMMAKSGTLATGSAKGRFRLSLRLNALRVHVMRAVPEPTMAVASRPDTERRRPSGAPVKATRKVRDPPAESSLQSALSESPALLSVT